MAGFITSEWNNVCLGLDVADSWFARVADGFLLIGVALLLFKKAWKDKWKSWEDIVMRWALYLFISIFLMNSFIVVPYRQLSAAQQGKRKSEKEASDYKKKLEESDEDRQRLTEELAVKANGGEQSQDVKSLDSQVAALEAQLTPPTITKADHDKFVAKLKGAAKGEVYIWESTPSLTTANYIKEVRAMLDDAGYGTKDTIDEQAGVSPLIGASISLSEAEGNTVPPSRVYMILPSKDTKEYPPYAGDVQNAFQSIGVTAIAIVQDKGMYKVDPGHIAIFIVDIR